MNPATLERNIVSGQQQIVDLKKRLASIDAELSSFAKKHLARIPYKVSAEGILPIELAQLLAVDAGRHSWLPDIVTLDPRYDPRFNDDDILRVRKARRLLGKDICYATAKIPALSDLPDGGQIVAIHEDLANNTLLERKIESGHFSRVRIISAESRERCVALSESIKQMILLWDTVDELIWLKPFVRIWLEGEVESENVKLLENLLIAIGDVRNKRTEILTYAISCPNEIIGDPDVLEAVYRAAAGDRPFGVLPFGKTQARQRFSTIRIEGRVPNSQERWYKVERYLAWRSKLSSTIYSWNALAGEFSLPTLKDQGEITARWLSETFDKVEKVKSAVRQDAPTIKREVPDLFSYHIDVGLVINSRDHAFKVIESIEANIAAMRYGTDLMEFLYHGV
jgi:hypothetical protein